MLTIKAMTDGQNYAAHHLSNNDYYSVGETITGQWVGRGAKMLGLQGEVNLDDLEQIRKGVDPRTGGYLRPRQSADRYDVAGNQIGTARTLYDFTLSAPKAVSVMSIQDPRIVDAHNLAAAEAIEEIETLAGARVRKGGANRDRVTGNLVIAAYQHDTSRELDPQLHTHFVAGNLTYDAAENRWKALQASEIYAEVEYLTEVYRNALARELRVRGYETVDRFEHGKDNGFGIVGIQEETLEKFSRRSAQRDAAIQDFLDRNGRLPSNNEIAILIRDSRPEKLHEITTAEVKANQRARLTPEEAQTLASLHEMAQQHSPVQQETWNRIAELRAEGTTIQFSRSGLQLVISDLEKRVSTSIGDDDPYWEQWYNANGRPLEDAPDAWKNPKINEYLKKLHDRYEEWRTGEVEADQKKLDGFRSEMERLESRDTTVLKERIELKAQAASATQEFLSANRQPAGRSMDHAAEHIFDRVSVAKDYELKAESLRHGRGQLDLDEVKANLRDRIDRGSMLSAQGEVATLESLERERRMVAVINDGIGRYAPLGSKDFTVSDRLRPEQKAVVLSVLDSHDFAVNIRGAAGTGKTTTLEELRRGLTEAKLLPVAVAPTTSATEELQKVGFQSAVTLSRLLSDPLQQEKLQGQVLILDEAGMVASKDMEAVLKLAKDKQARIVFSGDTAQIKSVSEGDALRVLERESQLKSMSLLQVQRQTNLEYRQAVESLRNHPADGYARLERMGAIREVDWRLRSHEVAQAYREASLVPTPAGKERDVLVIAGTHNEIKNVTYAVRQDRKRRNELGAGEQVHHDTDLSWTEAQRKRFGNYQPGQVIAFHKTVRGIAEKHEALEVVSADKSGVTARRTDGQDVRITEKQVKAYSVYEREQIEVAAGDKLLLQSNWRDKDFRATNGELVKVASVQHGCIRLEDGRQLPEAYRQFTHGYAVTAHRSQGKTVDFEIIAAERMAQDLFYVSVSRAREGVTVITSDSQALQESIGVSGDRQSATELAREAARSKRCIAPDVLDSAVGVSKYIESRSSREV